MMNGGAMEMDGFMNWGGMFVGPLVMLVVAGLVIACIVMLFRMIASPKAAGNSPLDTLKTRFARGEIDKREYEEQYRILNG